MRVLLEHQPLEYLGALEPILGDVLGPVSEVPQDRVGLSQRATVIQHQHRHPQRRIEPAKDFGAVGAVEHVDLAQL